MSSINGNGTMLSSANISLGISKSESMSVSKSYSDVVIVLCWFSELFDCDVEGTGLLYNRKLNRLS